MVAKLLHSRLCLLLLLGLLGIVPLLQAMPPGLTKYQWFTIQHINTGNIQCNIAMQGVNNYTGKSKEFNTFLNTTSANAATVCGTQNVTCRNQMHHNCHNSLVRVPLTDCDLTRNASYYENCIYSERRATKYYRIACDPRSPQDNVTFPVVPVHLDETFTLF
jgi:hypothetical protein